MAKLRDIGAKAGQALLFSGVAFMVGRHLVQLKMDEFLAKSVHVQVADNAPAAVKALLGSMDLSVKMRDLYDRATTGQPSPLEKYFKITVR